MITAISNQIVTLALRLITAVITAISNQIVTLALRLITAVITAISNQIVTLALRLITAMLIAISKLNRNPRVTSYHVNPLAVIMAPSTSIQIVTLALRLITTVIWHHVLWQQPELISFSTPIPIPNMPYRGNPVASSASTPHSAISA